MPSSTFTPSPHHTHHTVVHIHVPPIILFVFISLCLIETYMEAPSISLDKSRAPPHDTPEQLALGLGAGAASRPGQLGVPVPDKAVPLSAPLSQFMWISQLWNWWLIPISTNTLCTPDKVCPQAQSSFPPIFPRFWGPERERDSFEASTAVHWIVLRKVHSFIIILYLV